MGIQENVKETMLTDEITVFFKQKEYRNLIDARAILVSLFIVAVRHQSVS